MDRINSHTKLTITVACLLVTNGTIGLLSFLSLINVSNNEFSLLFILFLGIALSATGILSGAFILNRRLWAFKTGLAFYVIQLVSIEIPPYKFEITSGFDVFYTIMINGNSYGINGFSVIMIAIILIALKQIEDINA